VGRHHDSGADAGIQNDFHRADGLTAGNGSQVALRIGSSGQNAGITFGGDVELRRFGANNLRLGSGDQIQAQQDPVLDNDLARKKYVDDQVGGVTGFVADTGDTMTGALTFDNDLVGVLNPTLEFIRNSTGLRNFAMDISGRMAWSNPGTGAEDFSITRLGSTGLQMSAGSFLNILQDPVGANEVTRKAYVDNKFVELAGDTMTGQLVTAGGSANGIDFGGATLYSAAGTLLRWPGATLEIRDVSDVTGDGLTVIDHNKVEVIGKVGLNANVRIDTDTGTSLIIGPSASNANVAVDADGKVRLGSGAGATDWEMQRTAADIVQLGAGDTLRIQQDPVDDNDLARKKYVDDNVVTSLAGSAITNVPAGGIAATDVQAAINELDGDKVGKGGDTMTGSLLFSAGAGIISTQSGSPNNSILESKHSGTFDAFRINANGKHIWDTNSDGSPDVSINAVGNLLVVGDSGKVQQAVAPTVDNDLANKKYVDDQVTATSNRVARSFTATEASNSSDTVDTQAATLATGVLAAGDYMLSVGLQSKASSDDRSTQVTVELDNTTELFPMMVHCDKSNAPEYHHSYMRKQVTLAAGSHNIDVDFQIHTGGGTNYVKDIEIILETV